VSGVPARLPEGVDLATWNASIGKRWNWFVTDLRREPGVELEYFKATEVQRRGALHLHLAMRFRRPCRVGTSRLRELAMRWGFGHEITLVEMRGEGGAWYVTKHVSEAADERSMVPWTSTPTVNERTGEITPGPRSYRTWTASRGWGETMAAVKREQVRWARAQFESPPTAASSAPLDVDALDSPKSKSYANACVGLGLQQPM